MALALADVLKRADARLGVRGMDADVVRIVRDVIKELHPQGIYVGVAQAMRTIAEQNALYAQGRTRPGAIVTNARGGQSNHNYGVAVDLFVYPGTFAKAEFLQPSDTRMKKIVAAMKKRGMKWGGDWSSFKDYPHFELYNAVGGQKKPSLSSIPAVQPSSSVYVVKSGDTLSGIKVKTGVTIENLKKYNSLKSDLIYVGQVLKLKASAKAVTKPVVAKDLVPYPGLLYKGKSGMKKAHIERLQRAVKADVTGKFDEQTRQAVIAYQKRKGLAADGIVGQSTHSMLF